MRGVILSTEPLGGDRDRMGITSLPQVLDTQKNTSVEVYREKADASSLWSFQSSHVEVDEFEQFIFQKWNSTRIGESRES